MMIQTHNLNVLLQQTAQATNNEPSIKLLILFYVIGMQFSSNEWKL